MEVIRFTKWNGMGGLVEHIIKETGCTPFSGAGINIRRELQTALLKSVDDTPYYDDDLSVPDAIEYTLFGQIGDQDLNEKRFNEPLLNPVKVQHIYVFRQNKREKTYYWYGKYQMIGRPMPKRHPDKNGVERTILVLNLMRINQ